MRNYLEAEVKGKTAAGVCIGAYDKVSEYASNRMQFGKSLTSFQLVQEKLARMMCNIQTVLYFAKRVSDLYVQGYNWNGRVK